MKETIEGFTLVYAYRSDSVRQYTLYRSDSEEDLTSEQNHSSTVETVNVDKSSSILETPD